MSIKFSALAVAALVAFGFASLPANAAPPSFDCGAGNRNAAERAICQSRYLSRLDRGMSRKYFEVHGMLAPWAQARLRNVQRRWLNARNNCGGWRRCIARAYGWRIRQLNQIESCFDDSASPRCIRRKLRRHSWLW